MINFKSRKQKNYSFTVHYLLQYLVIYFHYYDYIALCEISLRMIITNCIFRCIRDDTFQEILLSCSVEKNRNVYNFRKFLIFQAILVEVSGCLCKHFPMYFLKFIRDDTFQEISRFQEILLSISVQKKLGILNVS